jgi:hypothetical protein
MSRVPSYPPKPFRVELTDIGLAVVAPETIRTEEARAILAEIDRQANAIANAPSDVPKGSAGR